MSSSCFSALVVELQCSSPQEGNVERLVENQPVSLQGKWEDDEGERGGGEEQKQLLWYRSGIAPPHLKAKELAK